MVTALLASLVMQAGGAVPMPVWGVPPFAFACSLTTQHGRQTLFVVEMGGDQSSNYFEFRPQGASWPVEAVFRDVTDARKIPQQDSSFHFLFHGQTTRSVPTRFEMAFRGPSDEQQWFAEVRLEQGGDSAQGRCSSIPVP